MPQEIYELSEEEMQIITASLEKPNIFFDYFFRKEGREHGWQLDYQFTPEGKWQEKMCMATQTFIVAISGIATGKTVGAVMSAAYHGVVTQGFKFLNVAKEAWQSMLMYKALLEQAEGTIFDKMIIERPRRPYPMIKIAYKVGGRTITSTLEFMSLGEAGDGSNIFSWRGDWINIEEAGRIDELSQLVTMLVTRLTGVTADGRTFLGRLSLISNPWDNTDMWSLYDMASADPEGLVFNIDTTENKNVSQKQVDMALKLIPDDQRARFLSGKKPQGRGTYFPDAIVAPCESTYLSDMLMDGISKNLPGYEMDSLINLGVWNFRIPRKDGRIYFVIGDPGDGQAPSRNAPVIGVFDVTDAPRSNPLVSLWWGNGHGKISPFVTKLIEMIEHYGPMYVGVDSTATQKNTAELINLEYIDGKNYSVSSINGLDFAGGRKMTYLVSAKLALESKSIMWPSIVTGISSQLRNYDPAQDKADSRLQQDLVAMVAMFAFVVRLHFGFNKNPDSPPPSESGDQDNYIVRTDRTSEPAGRTTRSFQRDPWRR
jgi:hypothetical protein